MLGELCISWDARSPTQDAEKIVTHQDCYELGLGGSPSFKPGPLLPRMHQTGESFASQIRPSRIHDTLFMNKKRKQNPSKQQTTPKKKHATKKKILDHTGTA